MLIAKVTFTDVDGRSIQKHYTGTDAEEVINRVGYNITDEYNYPHTKRPKFPGLNGTIDIDKPISIVIAPISFEE